MTDFVVWRSVRETLAGGPVGNLVVQRAVREALVGGPVGNLVVNRCVREILIGTVPAPGGGTTAIPKRAAQIIG